MARLDTEALKAQFERIERRIRALATGTTSAGGMILCGPPGWGKTFTVRRVLHDAGITPVITTVNNEHAFVWTLLQNSLAPVIVADDTDQLATRPSCLNIIKGAFGPDHEVVWDSRDAQKAFGNGLRFKIKSRLIWISNQDYTNSTSRREDLQAHWGALESRGIRPLWLDTTDQEDAFKYIVRLACTSPAMWNLRQPLGKIKSEEVIRWFCENRDRLLELSPRTLTRAIDAFHVARDDIKHRDDELSELLSPTPLRSIADIVPPTIVGRGAWRDVPIMAGDDQPEPEPPKPGPNKRKPQQKAKPDDKPEPVYQQDLMRAKQLFDEGDALYKEGDLLKAQAAKAAQRHRGHAGQQLLLEHKSHLITDFPVTRVSPSQRNTTDDDAAPDESNPNVSHWQKNKDNRSLNHTYSVGDRVFNMRCQRMATIKKIKRVIFDEYGDEDEEEFFQSINPFEAYKSLLMEGDTEDFHIVEVTGRDKECLICEFCLPEDAKLYPMDCM